MTRAGAEPQRRTRDVREDCRNAMNDDYDPEKDAIGSYHDGIAALRERQKVRIIHGDCLEVIPQLVAEGVQVDAVCCDPPYHLTSGNVAFDWDAMGPTDNPKRGQRDPQTGLFKRTGGTNRAGRDHKTGFMGKAWDGGDIAFRPETWAAIATVLRPGGFLLSFGGTRTWHRMVCAIEDSGLVIQDCVMWLYGSGFPKRRDMLKPAWEPVIVAYKPGGKRTLQVEECRIGTEERFNPWKGTPSEGWGHSQHGDDGGSTVTGRWPANVCHDGSGEVMEAFAAFGGRDSGGPSRRPPGHYARTTNGFFASDQIPSGHIVGYQDIGTAARFFYCSKADAEDRWGSRHPTVKPVELIKWLVKLVTPPNGLVLDCFAGSGTTGVAALATVRRAIIIERELEYYNDIRERLAFYEGEGRHSVASKNRSRAAHNELPLFPGE